MSGGAYQHICHKGDPELSQLVSVSEHNDISKYNTVEGEHHLLKNHAATYCHFSIAKSGK